jgi:hypothetical protein
MSTRAIAADGEQIVAADTYVSSALAFPVQAFLPKINDGSGATVAVDKVYRIETTGAAPVELLTQGGRRVGIVPGRSQAVAVARTGTVQAEPDDWNFILVPQTPVAVATAAPAGGTGVAAGGYDTAGNRDTMITLVNAMRTCLIGVGLMKAE